MHVVFTIYKSANQLMIWLGTFVASFAAPKTMVGNPAKS